MCRVAPQTIMKNSKSFYSAADIEENITNKEEQEEGVDEIQVCAK